MSLTLDDFDFDLPAELIAQHPAAERPASRLLHLAGAALTDRRFAELPQQLRRGDLLVVNDTRVVKARLFGRKASGGQVEVLIERVLDDRRALAQLRASKTPRAGSEIELEAAFAVRVGERAGEFFALELPATQPESWWTLCERHGHLPLPPYITHVPDAGDEARYQTVYARHPGAVAAPTAGLHFDEALLAELQRGGVGVARITLHVGAGTFQPVRVRDLAEHRMHSERYAVPAATAAAIAATRAAGGRVVAVGTTSLRTLEAATAAGDSVPAAGEGETALFIVPGYRFRCVDRLITNFHLPRSTLLMLVSAFAGSAETRRAYRHAIDARYRFFSYGDAMLIERNDDAV